MSDKTSFFAPEIERALVSTVWHHPEYLELVHRDLDLELHFHEPNLRIVLEMISLVFWEIGAVDWATVVHAIREVDALELCGGRQGLNEVFTDGGYFPWGPREPEPLVQEYIRLLQDYAAQRQAASEKIPIHFTGGKGRIVPNKLARSDRDPSDVGQAWIRGRRYRIRGWRDGDGLDIKFYPEGR